MKTAETNKLRYGADYYHVISQAGGRVKAKKGFALMDKDRLREVARKGGRSRWKKESWLTAFFKGFSRGR